MIKFKALILILALFTIQQLSFAQNFTVTIKTDYCSVPGSVKLTANPDPASNDYFFTWNTIPIENTKDIVVNVAGQYTVTVKNGGGDEVTQTLNISSNLVVNGDFELGNVGFTSTYIYTNPGPDSLWQENRYTVDENPSFSHINFWGKDHTTNSGKFMIINGVGSSSVWSQKIDNLLSNTDYYFSAYAISLNSVNPFANLQFSVNGIQIGTVTGPLPSRPNNNNPPYDWTQFYGIWNSGSSNSVVLSIADLESALDGNDFGLDDISFGTITPLPLAINVNANKPCEGDALQLTTTIDGGKYPYSFSWTGPAGFTSELPNPVIPNVSMANAGSYTVNVTDGNSCSPPVSKDITVIVNPAITGGSITGASTTCAGSTSDLLTLAGNSGSVVNWQRSVAPFTTWTDIPNTEATFTSGILPQTTHFRAVVQNESCIGYSDAAIVIIDNTPPTITTIAENRTVECDGNGNSTELNAWLASNGGAIASDNISGISWTNNFTTLNSLCGASGSADVTFTAKDNCGNISSTIATFTIVDITAPILSSVPANVTVDCSAVPLAATLTASDNCDATPIVTFNEVRTEGACPNSYILTRTWTAKDACSNTSSVSQIITIQDLTAPVLSDAPANVTVECNAVPLAATLTAKDNCDATPIVTFNEVRTEGACPNSYILTRTWTAKDACSNTSSVSQAITVQDVTAPVLSDAPANVTVQCNAIPLAATLTASDNCDGTPIVTFNEVRTDGTCPNSYILTRTWTTKDACSNTSSVSQIITVQDVTAPVLSDAPANVTVECSAVPFAATLTATDNCDAAPAVTFKEVRSDGTCANSYILTRTWTATDACSNTSSVSQIITVQDVTAPTLSCPENITVNNDPGICGATITVPKPSVTENCGTALLINNFNHTSDASGLYPGGVTTVLWTVADDCGNASTCEMTVTVNDTEKPAITCPSSITLCSGEQPVLGTATATDNCDKAPIISNNAPSIFVVGTTTVIWTATDLHGNTSTCTQLVTISPKVTASAGSAATLCSTIPYQLSGATAANFASVAWSHNGHGSLSNSTILNPTYTPSAGETGSIEFTLTAKGLSECGNTEASDKFVLTIYPALNVNAGLDTIIGSGTSITLHSQVSGGSGVYVYKWSPAEFLVDNTKIKPVTVPLTNVTVFTLNILDELSRCNASDDVKISINDVIRPIARDDYARTDFTHSINVNVQANDSDPIGLGLTISISVDPKKGSAIVNEDGTITYTNLPNYTGKEIQDTLTYIICDKGAPSKCASARLIITISQERQEFEIFNLLTPNGDGKNDYWQINGIELYPNNEITLFNRWGDKINQYTGYNNTDKRWNGTNENKEFLPDGVYFYIIKLNDQNANPNTYKGWVYVRGKGGN